MFFRSKRVNWRPGGTRLSIAASMVARFVEFAANCVVVGGVLLFYNGLTESKKSEKRSNSIEFIQLFNSSELREARLSLSIPWLDIQEQIEIANSVGGISQADKTKLVDSIVNTSTNNSYQKSILAIDEFYQNVWACNQSSICDGEVADRFFDPYYKSFYCLFGSAIKSSNSKLGLESAHINKFNDSGC
jgi:hypothetical protein